MDRFNRWLDRFCYRHRNFGIRNLMRYIVILNVLVFILSMVDTNGTFIQYLYFMPQKILRGEIWRIVTWVFLPVSGGSNVVTRLFYFAVMQYFYYFIGMRLESAWGAGKFTIYYFMNIAVTAVLTCIAYICTHSIYTFFISATYINLSMFFAFATLYPEEHVLLFFFIPIKIRWLAYIDAAYQIYRIIYMSIAGYFPLNLLPLFACVTYFLFFGSTLFYVIKHKTVRTKTYRDTKNTIDFQKARKQAQKDNGQRRYTKKCAVCGKTDTDYPNLDFRYCSKCQGFHCFCPDHLYSHVHFTE